MQRIMMLRMSGEDVRLLQNKLKEFGFYKERVDGFFGQNTLVSVTNFQRKVGVRADGVVGPQTWSQILAYNPNPTPVEIENKKIEEKNQNTYKPVVKVDIPHEISYIGDDGLTIYDCLLPDDEYYKKPTQKNTIWLHHTAGGSRPDWTISGWDKDFQKDERGEAILDKNGKIKALRVGTSFVIGRSSSSKSDGLWDGKILRAFDDRYWAYHLGINHDMSLDLNSKSVGIEICNYGPLRLTKEGKFINYVNKEVNESDVCELSRPFRGYKYWEKYTEKQLDSTARLITYLNKRWQIEIEKGIYNEEWFEYNSKWFSLGGLRTHTQVRRDKFDLFPQKELIEMLNSL
jgi:peptidoglycan hydrolase-like protein with peptidoglycan-binding domain